MFKSRCLTLLTTSEFLLVDKSQRIRDRSCHIHNQNFDDILGLHNEKDLLPTAQKLLTVYKWTLNDVKSGFSLIRWNMWKLLCLLAEITFRLHGLRFFAIRK